MWFRREPPCPEDLALGGLTPEEKREFLLALDDPTPCERCEELKAELRQADQRWVELTNENARLRLRLAMESGDE